MTLIQNFVNSYYPSGVLFRISIEQHERCKKLTAIESDSIETKCRRNDSAIICLLTAHAAMESALHSELVMSGLPGIDWPSGVHVAIKNLATARNRPRVEDLSPNLIQRFEIIAAYRNFFQHGDESSRERLKAKVPNISWDTFDSSLTDEVIKVADEFFQYLTINTGAQLIGPSNLLWINPAVVGAI
jgi:hypothetical protein